MKVTAEFQNQQGQILRIHPGDLGQFNIILQMEDNDGILPPGTLIEIWRSSNKFILSMKKQVKNPNTDDFVYVESIGNFKTEISWLPDNYKQRKEMMLKIAENYMQPDDRIIIHLGDNSVHPIKIVPYLNPPTTFTISIKRPKEKSFTNFGSFLLKMEADAPARLVSIIPSVLNINELFSINMRWEDKNCAPCAQFPPEIEYIIKKIDPINVTTPTNYKLKKGKNTDLRQLFEENKNLDEISNGFEAERNIEENKRDNVINEDPWKNPVKITELGPINFEKNTYQIHDRSISTPGIFQFVFRVPKKYIDNFGGWTEDNIQEKYYSDKNFAYFGSNVTIVRKNPPIRLYWGDAHTHTEWRDGSGSWEYNYEYARDIVFLDFFSETEHIYTSNGTENRPWIKPKYSDRLIDINWYWSEKQKYCRKFNSENNFITFLGYEWTPKRSWTPGMGHHVVYFLNDDSPLIFENSVEKLINKLKEQGDSFLVPHVGGRIPTLFYHNWEQKVLPLIEIASVQGSSEYYLQESLLRGYKMGVCAMGDIHTGNPGNDTWAIQGRLGIKPRTIGIKSGITACFSENLTRKNIFNAMQTGQTYATTGIRPLIEFKIDNAKLNSKIDNRDNSKNDNFIVFRVKIACNIPIDRIDIIAGLHTIHSWQSKPEDFLKAIFLNFGIEKNKLPIVPTLKDLYSYIRITFRDGNFAWSSPIWLENINLNFNEKKIGMNHQNETNSQFPLWFEEEWPNRNLSLKLEESDKNNVVDRFNEMLKNWNLDQRYEDLEFSGVFLDYRGKYVRYNGFDTKAKQICHLNLYLNFPDNRLYVKCGRSDFGVYDYPYRKPKWNGRAEILLSHIENPDNLPNLPKFVPLLDPKYKDKFTPEIFSGYIKMDYSDEDPIRNGSENLFFLENYMVNPNLEAIYHELENIKRKDGIYCLGIENYNGDWILALLKENIWYIESPESFKKSNLEEIKNFIKKIYNFL